MVGVAGAGKKRRGGGGQRGGEGDGKGAAPIGEAGVAAWPDRPRSGGQPGREDRSKRAEGVPAQPVESVTSCAKSGGVSRAGTQPSPVSRAMAHWGGMRGGWGGGGGAMRRLRYLCMSTPTQHSGGSDTGRTRRRTHTQQGSLAPNGSVWDAKSFDMDATCDPPPSWRSQLCSSNSSGCDQWVGSSDRSSDSPLVNPRPGVTPGGQRPERDNEREEWRLTKPECRPQGAHSIRKRRGTAGGPDEPQRGRRRTGDPGRPDPDAGRQACGWVDGHASRVTGAHSTPERQRAVRSTTRSKRAARPRTWVAHHE